MRANSEPFILISAIKGVMENKYYVYEWYNVDTGDIFYVGKGSGDRYRQKQPTKRNRYFIRYINKHNCLSRKIKENLTEQEAYEFERETIQLYKDAGYKLVNFDEGGRAGGKCIGEDNGMYGRTHTPEAISKIRAANLNGRNAGVNNSQYGISPKNRMDEKTYEIWRNKQHQRKFGNTNPNCHATILMDKNRNIVRKFDYIVECAKWLIETEQIDNTVENIRTQLKYYNKTGHLMLQKYYVQIIRPIKDGNTVPSLSNEEG